MIQNIIENEKYKLLIEKQMKEIIEFMIGQNQEFSITANIEPIKFNPELPKSIKDLLHKYSLFVLSNYTYSTIQIDEKFISFEAGFGEENFGSVVKVPLYAIFQIIVNESILHINPVATVDKFNKDLKSNSMNRFKNNPNNKRFN